MRPFCLVLSLVCVLFLIPAISAELSSIDVRGKTIRVGDAAESIFATLKPSDAKKTVIARDPDNPRSRVVTHYYEVEGKSFSLTFARIIDSGSFQLIRISTSSENE